MSLNFEKIPQEEQQRILTISLAEFADKGYELASTNSIVKKAGIPKGTLFYYFGSKKALYLYLIDHAVACYTAEVDSSLADLPGELFERLLAMHRLRFDFVVREPLLYRLLFNSFMHTPESLRAELQTRIRQYGTLSAQRRLDGLDRSRFKDDVDVEKTLELVSLVSEGIFNRYLGALKNAAPEQSLKLVEKIAGEMEAYFELIKRGV